MVVIQRNSHRKNPATKVTLVLVFISISIILYYFLVVSNDNAVAALVSTTKDHEILRKKAKPLSSSDHHPHEMIIQESDEKKQKTNNNDDEQQQEENNNVQCPIMKISDLSVEERFPKEGSRHMITPPMGGEMFLVCCQTTKGPLSIMVHEIWAPNGANRFLEMVQHHYFKKRVPMMRCIHNWLCQFGLSSDPAYSKLYRKNLVDDPQWLPKGPDHRQNANGVKRFAQGYLAYAGSGANSRNNQFIVALQPNGPLAGGSPWEVPWGELVGSYSFDTLSKIYTGYGEEGPGQGVLWNKGMTDAVAQDFPNLDYITGCSLVDKALQEKEEEQS